MNKHALTIAACLGGLLVAPAASADLFSFSTGDPDGLIATNSRPASAGKVEIESADDFTTTAPATKLTSATFTGLLTGTTPSVSQVIVEIYRIFPKDSNTARTSFPTLPFSTALVPARANSPSDVELVGRSSLAGDLTFSTATLNSSFSTARSVITGINPKPNQTTGGDGPVTGTEVLFDVTFTDPIFLPADHYFFVPQVEVDDGEFLWLSAPKTLPAPGDLQSWIRDENLAPDWLRVGTDIIGGSPAPNFNASFSLTGAVPEPAPLLLLLLPAVSLFARRRRSSR